MTKFSSTNVSFFFVKDYIRLSRKIIMKIEFNMRCDNWIENSNVILFFPSNPFLNVTVTSLTSLSISITSYSIFHFKSSTQKPHKSKSNSLILPFPQHRSIKNHSSTTTMALRPIENALPTITQERPKKQPKIAVSTQKPQQQQPRTSSNDENQIPLEPTIDYISSDNLKPMSDPEAQIQVSIKIQSFFVSNEFFYL